MFDHRRHGRLPRGRRFSPHEHASTVAQQAAGRLLITLLSIVNEAANRARDRWSRCRSCLRKPTRQWIRTAICFLLSAGHRQTINRPLCHCRVLQLLGEFSQLLLRLDVKCYSAPRASGERHVVSESSTQHQCKAKYSIRQAPRCDPRGRASRSRSRHCTRSCSFSILPAFTHTIHHQLSLSLPTSVPMMAPSFFPTTVLIAAVVTLFAATPAHGHGLLMKPKLTFKAGVQDVSSYTGTMLGNVVYPGSSFTGSFETNVKTFTQRFKSDAQHRDIKTLIAKNQKLFGDRIADATCGYTDPTKSAEVLDGDSITYGRYIAGMREGFVHPGPCETWCDNAMVQQDMDCMAKYKAPYGTPSVVPIDAAKCKGAKQLTFYWLGVQNNEWQIYINCVGLSGASSNSASANGTTNTADKATTTPAHTSRAPVAVPAATTPTRTPAPSTSAKTTPTTTLPSSKCATKSSRQLRHEQQQ